VKPAERKARPPPRPRRGAPDETRRRLVAAAAEEFNRVGYEGTDSNRLARAAGYAPGTFYKHFRDKRDIFLAAYAEWVTQEWDEVSRRLLQAGTAQARAAQTVELLLAHHRRWRGLRASLRMLVAVDGPVREFYREQRRRQLDWLERLRAAAGDPPGSREDDALLLYTLERTADAIADGEPAALQLRAEGLERRLVEEVARQLRPR